MPTNIVNTTTIEPQANHGTCSTSLTTINAAPLATNQTVRVKSLYVTNTNATTDRTITITVGGFNLCSNLTVPAGSIFSVFSRPVYLNNQNIQISASGTDVVWYLNQELMSDVAA